MEMKPKIEIMMLEDYLNRTDWMVIRQVETGVAMPDDIKLKRNDARKRISELKDVDQ